VQQPLEILAPPSPRLPLSQSLPLPSILPQPLIFLPPRPRLLLAHSKLTTANVVDKDIAVPLLASLHTPASTLTNITPSACNLRTVPKKSRVYVQKYTYEVGVYVRSTQVYFMQGLR